MAWFRNVRMTPKLIGSFVLVAILTAVVAGAGFLGLQAQDSQVAHISNVSVPNVVALLETQRDLANAVRYSRGEILASSSTEIAQFQAKAAAARALALQDWQVELASPFDNAQEQTLSSQMTPLFQQWAASETQVEQLASKNTTAADAQAHSLSAGAETQLATTLTTDLNTLFASYQSYLHSAVTDAHSAYTTANTELLIVLLAAIALALGLGWFIARSITRPLAEVQAAASSVANVCMTGLAEGITALSRGDLTVEAKVSTAPPTYSAKDEIGMTADVVRAIIGKAQTAIHAYEEARADLATLIGQVARSSEQVNAGSNQLAQAAQQIGQASTQIAQSIEEVARGTGEQSKDSSAAIEQMTALSAAVQQVASGAEAQRHVMEGQASHAIAALRVSLDDTTRNVDLVSSAAARAAATAKDGGGAVAQTISSIESVRAAVTKSAEYVAALGAHSQEIGQIVDAIDDIASQTNLLALNAAIEAARAGEHGKGFTVVAAEVRKLAERSSSETKEITQRISAIQQQVADVVRAMQVGSTEVEKSATLGRQAEAALASILGVVEETHAQAAVISTAVHGMTDGLTAVEAAAGRVATVAAETAEAAGQMRQGALRVQGSVESIAAVGEQTAAGAQQVRGAPHICVAEAG